MKKNVILFLWILIAPTLNANPLQDFCLKEEGAYVKGFTCPQSRIRLFHEVCYFESETQDLLFTDGCTGPNGGFGDDFFLSCVKHDLCYHHEPATNGKDRKFCDDQFRENLLENCKSVDAERRSSCELWAKIMSGAVRTVGGIAFRCENKFVESYDL